MRWRVAWRQPDRAGVLLARVEQAARTRLVPRQTGRGEGADSGSHITAAHGALDCKVLQQYRLLNRRERSITSTYWGLMSSRL